MSKKKTEPLTLRSKHIAALRKMLVLRRKLAERARKYFEETAEKLALAECPFKVGDVVASNNFSQSWSNRVEVYLIERIVPDYNSLRLREDEDEEHLPENTWVMSGFPVTPSGVIHGRYKTAKRIWDRSFVVIGSGDPDTRKIIDFDIVELGKLVLRAEKENAKAREKPLILD